jgi:hypothetical protein
MSKNLRDYYDDEDYEDSYQKTERIPQKPRREELDKNKDTNRVKPPSKKQKN